MNRTEFTTQLQEKIATDPAFREHLKQHPRKAVAEAFGLTIPPEVEITVIEETPQRMVLILPDQTAGSSESELADAELEGVSGGSIVQGDRFGAIGRLWDRIQGIWQ